jgi:hypothetical protein
MPVNQPCPALSGRGSRSFSGPPGRCPGLDCNWPFGPKCRLKNPKLEPEKSPIYLSAPRKHVQLTGPRFPRLHKSSMLGDSVETRMPGSVGEPLLSRTHAAVLRRPDGRTKGRPGSPVEPLRDWFHPPGSPPERGLRQRLLVVAWRMHARETRPIPEQTRRTALGVEAAGTWGVCRSAARTPCTNSRRRQAP